MATKPKAKNSVKSQASKSTKGSVFSSKKFSLSKKQWGIFGIVAVALLGIGTYFGIQQYQNTTADAASCISKTYKRGSNSVCVKYIQTMVNAAITYAKVPGAANATAHNKALSKLSKLSVDGNYGAKTEAAVKAFQTKGKVTKSDASARVWLPTNGVVAPITWGALCLNYGNKGVAKSAGCSGTPYKNVAWW